MSWEKTLNNYGEKRSAVAFFIKFDGSSADIISLNQLKKQDVLLDFPTYKMCTNDTPSEINLISTPIDFSIYRNAFERVQYHLHRGDSYLTNLTFETPIALNVGLDAVFHSVKAKYKIRFKNNWVCFSPETFIQIKGRKIKTFPMKGTIDATIPNAAEQLKTDLKEVAEHNTVVDLLRNDLSHVAKGVKVSRLMYLDKLKTQNGEILQMSSEIEGILSDNWHKELGSILKTLLPAGSISGAPKNKTIEIIQHVEGHQRGFYTGVAGIYDGEKVDSCVMIRFIEKTDKGFVYKSGGGITALSKLKDEYDELNQKIYVPVY